MDVESFQTEMGRQSLGFLLDQMACLKRSSKDSSDEISRRRVTEERSNLPSVRFVDFADFFCKTAKMAKYPVFSPFAYRTGSPRLILGLHGRVR